MIMKTYLIVITFNDFDFAMICDIRGNANFYIIIIIFIYGDAFCKNLF